MPRNHRIIGFEWSDPSTQREVLDGWSAGLLAGRMERDLRDAGVSSIPLAVNAAESGRQMAA